MWMLHAFSNTCGCCSRRIGAEHLWVKKALCGVDLFPVCNTGSEQSHLSGLQQRGVTHPLGAEACAVFECASLCVCVFVTRFLFLLPLVECFTCSCWLNEYYFVVGVRNYCQQTHSVRAVKPSQPGPTVATLLFRQTFTLFSFISIWT